MHKCIQYNFWNCNRTINNEKLILVLKAILKTLLITQILKIAIKYILKTTVKSRKNLALLLLYYYNS